MARKDKADEIVFCDNCGGSIPSQAEAVVLEQPDGSRRTVCQECSWTLKTTEDIPSLSLDENIEIGESARQSVRTAEEMPAPAGPTPPGLYAAAAGSTQGVAAAAPLLTHCKTFVAKATPPALEFLDQHITGFLRVNKITAKHATMCHGVGAIGSQGLKDHCLFITIWW